MPDIHSMHSGWSSSLGLREFGEEPPTHMDGPTDKEIEMARLEADKRSQPKRGRAICEDALKTINGARQDKYGNPEDTFALIANLWSAYLEVEVKAENVADMMCLLKIAREKGGKGKRDNMVDLIGYAALGAEMRGYE